MENRNGGAPGSTLLEVVHALKETVEALRGRVELLEAPGRLRVRELEVVDDEGDAALRLVVHEDGAAGLECLRPGDGGLVAFVGADVRGGHFVFVDPDDRTGDRVLAWMGRSGAPGRPEPGLRS